MNSGAPSRSRAAASAMCRSDRIPACTNMEAKYAKIAAGGANPFIDPAGYTLEVDIDEAMFLAVLAEQQRRPRRDGERRESGICARLCWHRSWRDSGAMARPKRRVGRSDKERRQALLPCSRSGRLQQRRYQLSVEQLRASAPARAAAGVRRRPAPRRGSHPRGISRFRGQNGRLSK